MSLKRFDAEDVLISSEKVSVPIWSNNTDTVSRRSIEPPTEEEADPEAHDDIFVHIVQEAGLAGKYYVDVFDAPESESYKSTVQFAIAYGNKFGSGSREFNKAVEGKSPSSVIWGQFRSLVLGDEEQDFVFGYGNPEGSYSATSFFALVIERSRFKEALRPGTLKLVLKNGDKELVLADNSRNVQSERYLDSGRVYDLVRLEDGKPEYPHSVLLPVKDDEGNIKQNDCGEDIYEEANYGSYGFLLPDIGVIILNAAVLKAELGLTIREERIPFEAELSDDFGTGWNMKNLFDVISSFTIQAEETVTSNYIFARARNSEFNYSTNPTNIDSAGELKHNRMINSPQAFITAIGLYNDANDLLAVAKLSRPLVKDFTKEALIRIKLDY